MVLEQFTLPKSPIVPFLTSVSASLANAKDNSTPVAKKIFQSVDFGVDAILQSAIYSSPNADECPLARIFFDPNRMIYDNAQAVGLFVNLPIEIYILFALDFPSPNFQTLRDSFVRLVLDNLKYNLFGDNRGLTPDTTWILNTKEAPIQHDLLSIRALGKTLTITPEGNFSLSRITLNALVKNYPVAS